MCLFALNSFRFCFVSGLVTAMSRWRRVLCVVSRIALIRSCWRALSVKRPRQADITCITPDYLALLPTGATLVSFEGYSKNQASILGPIVFQKIICSPLTCFSTEFVRDYVWMRSLVMCLGLVMTSNQGFLFQRHLSVGF